MTATYVHTQNSKSSLKTVLKLLAILYGAFVLAAIVYLWCFTHDRFVSIASFEISKQDASSVSPDVTQLLMPGLGGSGAMDAQVVIEYINSVDNLMELEKEFNLIRHYGSPPMDMVFKLDSDEPLEERLAYYRKRIFAHVNQETGLTMLTVDTFDPELSCAIAKAVLKKAEAFVNRINQNVADQQMEFTRSELQRASDHVDALNKELLTLQSQHQFISPDDAIGANLAAVNELRMIRMRSETELATLLRDSPESPRIEAMRSHLRTLNERIDVETAKLSGPEQDRLNHILIQFRELQKKLEFAISQRSTTLLMLEKNRVDAAARSRFFSVIQNPYLPEDVATPRRPYVTATILCLAALIFLTFRALTHSVFERA
jgi:capsular polysaccharide transport system permease protein